MSAALEPTYDDLLAFARVMYDVEWQYSGEPGERVLEFMEKPHKWNAEYLKWREFGGTLEKDCTNALDRWLENRNVCGQCGGSGCVECE